MAVKPRDSTVVHLMGAPIPFAEVAFGPLWSLFFCFLLPLRGQSLGRCEPVLQVLISLFLKFAFFEIRAESSPAVKIFNRFIFFF